MLLCTFSHVTCTLILLARLLCELSGFDLGLFGLMVDVFAVLQLIKCLLGAFTTVVFLKMLNHSSLMYVLMA